MIGFGGYYVWDGSQDNKSSDTVTQSQESDLEQADGSSQSTGNSEQEESGHLVIGELGIKMKLTDAEKLSYSLDQMTTKVFDETVVTTVVPEFLPAYLEDPTCTPGLALYASESEPADFKYTHIDGLYYFVSGGPGSCGNEADDALGGRFLSEFKIENIAAI